MFLSPLTLIWAVVHVQVTEQNEVSTAQGTLQGTDHDGYVSYRGIPYGTVAAVDGRFKKAGLAPFWSGVRESKESHCSPVSSVGDCLQLDVHVPTAGIGVGSNSWPVLLWVTAGTGQYNPRKLVQKGIIVVVVHHRIGPLGFLCLGDEKIPGNAAVKDVVLALRWVKDNIAAFKGNPDKVVPAGQSLGAAIVEAVTLTPMAAGLYHGAIIESGTILAPWAFNYDAKERAIMLAEMLSFDQEQTSLNVLMGARTEELVENGNDLNVPYFPFGMCIESPLKHEEILLSEAPIDLLTNKKAGKVPMIIGFNSNEAYIFASILRETREPRVYFLLPQELKFLNDREMQQTAKQVEDMYFRSNMSLASMLAYHRDAYFVSHIHRSVRLHASAHPVYFYRFSYSGDLGVQEEPGVEKTGAAHSDELTYLFSGRDMTGDDEVVQRNMINLWTNFVKYQNPTVEESTTWDTVDADHPRLLDIGTELQMMDYPHTHATSMWDDIFDKYYYSRNRGKN